MRRENRNALLGVMLAVGLAFSSAAVVYGIAISGKVKQPNGSGFNNAKVTAERQQDYGDTRSGSLGSYTVGVDNTMWYTVQAMASGWTQAKRVQISGGSTGIDLTLSQRPYEFIDVAIAADEEYRNANGGGTNWIDEAEAKLRLPEGWFTEEHSIKFRVEIFNLSWVTEQALGDTCGAFYTDVTEDLGWPVLAGDADILFAIIGETFPQGMKVQGCTTPNVAGPGEHPVVLIMNNAPDQQLLVMHELTHVYDYNHQCGLYRWYDVMESSLDGFGKCTVANTLFQIKNWRPSGDGVMEAHRDWYS